MNLPVSIWTNEDCVAFWAEERPETANADACMLKQEAQKRDLTIVRMILEDIIQQHVLLLRKLYVHVQIRCVFINLKLYFYPG